MFVLGLLALTLSAADRVHAKEGSVAEPITYDFVDLGDFAHAPKTREGTKEYFKSEGAKGMRFVTFVTYGRPDVPPLVPPTPGQAGIPDLGTMAVFASR